MERSNYWAEGPRHQWIFCAADNSSLEGLSEKIDQNEVCCADGSAIINLGVRRINGRLYAGNYVGVCRLKDINGKAIYTYDSREVVLKIQPRFPLSVVDMLNAIREDDEFERYLAPQTTRIGTNDRDVEDLMCNEVFHFFSDEDPIYLHDEIAKESSIITATVYLSLLRNLCQRPLMGKTVSKEENLVGKAKGKIVFSKNIRYNSLRGRDDRLYCRYLQYTEDIVENQVLKAALKKAEAYLSQYFRSVSGNNNSFRDMIAYCNNSLSHITHKQISRFDLNSIKTTGVYVSYKPVINAAKMVLNEITMAANGNTTLTSYVIPYAISMEKLFEMYIRSYLKKAGIKSFDSEDEGIHLARYDDKTAVLTERNKAFANYISGNIKPDIIIYDPETNKHVIFDVKYKDLSSSRFSRSDRMQILAYGLMFGSTDVGIIFPTQEGTNNVYYKQNKINSNENITRFYHQLEIAINNNWSFMLESKAGDGDIDLMDYLQEILK